MKSLKFLQIPNKSLPVFFHLQHGRSSAPPPPPLFPSPTDHLRRRWSTTCHAPNPLTPPSAAHPLPPAATPPRAPAAGCPISGELETTAPLLVPPSLAASLLHASSTALGRHLRRPCWPPACAPRRRTPLPRRPLVGVRRRGRFCLFLGQDHLLDLLSC